MVIGDTVGANDYSPLHFHARRYNDVLTGDLVLSTVPFMKPDIVLDTNIFVSALTTETYLAARAARGSVDKFHAALAKVPAVEPDECDRL